ncbi:hypothetical protein [Vreelandella venusta]|uniref:hypothetical protein n=1 Tax=Vreelandella venusta TaxID=44935 RepID=UPI00116DC982|nr:hypothetical protein [Halomonas venusta]GEK52380.1 hypothetical protein HVE01_31010 [Halomonas venusta]
MTEWTRPDLDDWEPRELGVEFSPFRNRWRYRISKELVPDHIPIEAILSWDIKQLESCRHYHGTRATKHSHHMRTFLDQRISLLKTIALISQ